MFRFTLLIALGVLSSAILFPQGASGQEEPHAHGRFIHDAHVDGGVHDASRGDAEPAPEFDLEPPRENFLIWFIGAMGWRYFLTLPASALCSFLLVALLLAKGKGSHLGAAMVFIVAIPFLIGLCAMLDSLITVYMVLAGSTVAPRYDQLAHGISISLVAPITALVLMVPSYLLATIGLTIRAFQGNSKA